MADEPECGYVRCSTKQLPKIVEMNKAHHTHTLFILMCSDPLHGAALEGVPTENVFCLERFCDGLSDSEDPFTPEQRGALEELTLFVTSKSKLAKKPEMVVAVCNGGKNRSGLACALAFRAFHGGPPPADFGVGPATNPYFQAVAARGLDAAPPPRPTRKRSSSQGAAVTTSSA